MLDFNDTQTAFVLKSDKQLRRAHWLFKLVGNTGLVRLGKWGSEFALGIGLPIKGLVKSTVYDQFVGGESIEECRDVIQKLKAHSVHSLLDYAVEGKAKEADFDSCKDEVIETIRYGAENDGMPFSVFKMTGVAAFNVMEKITAGYPLTESEKASWERSIKRVDEICAAAEKAGLYLMIDAEESWIQVAIDQLSLEMMAKYNKGKVVVINTYQMYRSDRLAFLKENQSQALANGYHFGAKLVRGAYMEKERERAQALSYPDPINPSKAESDRSYDGGLTFMVENIDNCVLVAGSHNENSALLLAQEIDKLGLNRSDNRIWFSQLYGMSDNLSFNLAKEGYNVVKYLPFGPVKETLPYLIRRAEENSSASGQSGRELSLIKKEINRRGLN